jgi:hypothetical protein
VHKLPLSTWQVRDKLAQLVNVRRHKMEQGLRQISATATVRVNGLGAYEVNLIRANLTGALDSFLRMETVRKGRGYERAVARRLAAAAPSAAASAAAACMERILHMHHAVRTFVQLDVRHTQPPRPAALSPLQVEASIAAPPVGSVSGSALS